MNESHERTFSPNISMGSDALAGEATKGGQASAHTLPKSPIPGNRGSRLPREGKKGGGKMRMSDRTLFEAVVNEFENLDDSGDAPSGLKKREDKSSDKKKRKDDKSGSAPTAAASGRPGGSEGSKSPRSKDKPNKAVGEEKTIRMSQKERKRAEIFSRWEKTEALRDRDQKDVLERVERGHERREDRYKRLYEAVTGKGNLAYKTAMALREREAHEDQRRRELHAEWEENVHRPLADQAHDYMNPRNRHMEQGLMGSKSVDFQMPNQKFNMIANVRSDPARKPLVALAREEKFHRLANAVLCGSASAPSLLQGTPGPPHALAPWPSFAAVSTPSRVINFTPEKLGLKADWNTGVVSYVHEGLQAHAKGVKPGWTIQAIDGHPYAVHLLDSRISGSSAYKVTFAETQAQSMVQKSSTRPVFEPTGWGQREIQGSMFGHFAQVCEHGPGFKRSVRSGTDAHRPDVSDGVLVAGSRRSRVHGMGDIGTLRGDLASLGESAQHKTMVGSSCGAPGQDHYAFETGSRVTDLEFPLGKKMFKEFH
jgi:hypothetical protein